MKKVKPGTSVLLIMLSVLVVLSSCSKDDDDRPVNYIKKENKYYKVDAALAIYDSIAPDKTIFSLNLHNNEADQSFVVFEYLLLQNTYDLLPGNYSYHTLPSSQNFVVGKFHDVVLKCNSPVMSGVVYPVTGGLLKILKNGNTYTVDGELTMSGKPYQVHFEGPIDHFKAW